jgi:uncharacterized lipoprotein YmbA
MRPGLLIAAACLFAAGCAGSPEMRYYALSPDANAERSTRMASDTARRVAITKVSIPDLIDRPQLVLRSGGNAIEVLEYDRWAAPLAEELRRVLAADLSARLGAGAVVDPGLPASVQADRSIAVSVLEFDSERTGHCVVEASWSISDASSGATKTFTARHSGAADRPAAKDIVAAMNLLVNRLASDIAETARTAF